MRALRDAAASIRSAILARLDPADRDIVPGREVEAHEILEDDADARAQLIEVVVAQVAAVEQDAALGRVVEAGQELHDRGLAGPVLADQGHDLAGPDARSRWRKAQRAMRPDSGSRHPRTRSPRADRRWKQGTGALGRANAGRDREEREQVVEILSLSRRAARRRAAGSRSARAGAGRPRPERSGRRPSEFVPTIVRQTITEVGRVIGERAEAREGAAGQAARLQPRGSRILDRTSARPERPETLATGGRSARKA